MRMSMNWSKWTFSSEIQDRVREFTVRMHQRNGDSIITKRWQLLKNKNFSTCVEISQTEALNETFNEQCDIEGLVNSTVEVIESDLNLVETKFMLLSTSQLTTVFTRVGDALTDSGFTNFCKILSTWNDDKLLNISFDNVIFQKMLEKEEATLSTITAIRELGKTQHHHLTKCIIKVLRNETYNFRDTELLEQVFDVLPDNQKEEIIRTIIQKEYFHESNWCLLQVLLFKTSSSLKNIITFMSSKCDEYADNQSFARLLVHICKNLQSDEHKELLINIIERNHSLLKHQAKKYLSAI